MATRIWRGDAQKVPQVDTITPGGTIGTETFTVTINGKDIAVTAEGGDTATEVAADLATAIGAYDHATIPEFAEVSATASSGVVTVTGPTDGKPVTITSAASGSATLVTASVTAASGPNHWGTAENWSGATAPVSSDTVIFETNDVDCLYDLDQSSVGLTAMYIRASYTGRIGLPVKNDDYYEYRDTVLAIQVATCVIGEGEGDGSPRLRFDFGSATATTVEVWKTGTSEDDQRPLVFKGTNASNTVRVYRGSVGIALERGSDTASVANLLIGYVEDEENDADVECGRGATVTNVSKTGGACLLHSATTTILNNAGSLIVEGSGTAASVVVNGGVVEYKSSGTITAFHVSADGVLDFGKDMQDRTVTNGNLYAGGSVTDPFRTVTWSNPLELTRCSLPEVTLDLGTHITLDPADA